MPIVFITLGISLCHLPIDKQNLHYQMRQCYNYYLIWFRFGNHQGREDRANQYVPHCGMR